MDNKCVEKLLETVAFSNGCICSVELIRWEHTHFHPSGDPQPSPHDFLVTSKLCAGGNILGIDVLDHIIVGGRTGKYHSMAKEGELENLRTKLLEPAKAVAEPLFQRAGKEKHRIRRR